MSPSRSATWRTGACQRRSCTSTRSTTASRSLQRGCQMVARHRLATPQTRMSPAHLSSVQVESWPKLFKPASNCAFCNCSTSVSSSLKKLACGNHNFAGGVCVCYFSAKIIVLEHDWPELTGFINFISWFIPLSCLAFSCCISVNKNVIPDFHRLFELQSKAVKREDGNYGYESISEGNQIERDRKKLN